MKNTFKNKIKTILENTFKMKIKTLLKFWLLFFCRCDNIWGGGSGTFRITPAPQHCLYKVYVQTFGCMLVMCL